MLLALGLQLLRVVSLSLGHPFGTSPQKVLVPPAQHSCATPLHPWLLLSTHAVRCRKPSGSSARQRIQSLCLPLNVRSCPFPASSSPNMTCFGIRLDDMRVTKSAKWSLLFRTVASMLWHPVLARSFGMIGRGRCNWACAIQDSA